MRKWENLGKLYKTPFLGWPWTLDAEDSQLCGRKNNTNWEGPISDPFRTHFPTFWGQFFQVRAARGARFWLQDWLCVQWHAGARDEPDWWIPSWLLRHCQTSRRRQTPSFRLKKFRRWNRWIKSEVMYPDECSHGSNWNTMRLGLSHYSLYIYTYGGHSKHFIVPALCLICLLWSLRCQDFDKYPSGLPEQISVGISHP